MPRTTGVARSIALAMLDHDVRAVALWTLQAIAHAWDTRSLGYGNEGKHPYELEVAALLGMNSGFANDYVGAARDHLATFEAALPPHPRTIDTPIGLLAAELGLSDLAIDVLLVVAAPAVWGEAARLYGILANDPARPLVDEQLVLQILAHRASRHDLAAVLDPRGALVRLGLVHMDLSRPRPFAALSIDPVALSRLRCEQPDLGAALSVRTSDRALEELSLAVGVVAAITAGLATWHGPLRLALSGRPGSGRRALLAALAAEAGRPLGVLDVTQLPRTEREFQLGFARGLRTAHLAGLLPCVTGIEEVSLGERAARDVVADILRAHPGPLAILQSAGAPAVLQAGHIGVELPVLDEGERLGLWQQTLADARLPVADVADLAAKYRIGPGTIHRAVSAAIERRGGHGPADATDELRTFIRQTRDARLGAYARRVERLVGWDALVLPSDIIDSLRELISRVRHRRTVFETWGMDRAMSTSRGLTALFQGQPGTGKTMVASVIAKELGLDLYQVDLSKVMSKWLGETERNLAAIFDAAEDGQVILLFDEADSLFAKRTEVRSSNDRYANLEVNYLLQRLDAFEGMAILTTNNGGSIDPAFKRRLSFRLSFPFPDEDTRTQLWRAHLPPRLPIAGELALERLAHKYQLAGGYIRNACLRAAFLAAQDETSLTQQHLERAVALEFAELGKLSTGGSLD
ncbi:MAG: ATP-binding protein [Myxococcales bacterium]|nr:ATP-binding protein [Myxococcales bacterium]